MAKRDVPPTEKNVGHRWQPGECPNPKGRPSLAVELARLLAETDEATGKGKVRLLAESLYQLAINGSVQAHALILDRVDGKVPQEIDVAVSLRDLSEQELRTRLQEARDEQERLEREFAGIAAKSGLD